MRISRNFLRSALCSSWGGSESAALHVERYTAVMTGTSSFALSRASLLKVIDTARKISLQHRSELKISKFYCLFALVSIVGAIPSWQFAQDTARTWPLILNFIFSSIQFTNIAAMNCRPLIETFDERLLNQEDRLSALEIRRVLLRTQNIPGISAANFERLCAGELTEESRYEKHKIALKIFMLLTAPIYAISYYFATQEAVQNWPEIISILVSLIAFALKTAFIWRTGFNLVDKIFSAVLDKPILALAHQSSLPWGVKIMASLLSAAAGITTASASAGTLLKYLLPQVGFLGDTKSINGLIVALAISVGANSFSKIYDIDALLRGFFEKILSCCGSQKIETEERNQQRQMEEYATMPLGVLLALRK